MHKIAFINPVKGHNVTVYYDDKAKVNPYRIYQEWHDRGKHKKQIERYANLYSCTCWINDYIRNRDEEKR